MGDFLKYDGMRVLIAFCLGWVCAQICKVIVLAVREKNFLVGIRAVLKSGGMPSGHTASMVAALVMIGRISGVFSVEFAIFACFTMIVIYDAVNVRWAVGEYGRAINGILGVDDELNGRGGGGVVRNARNVESEARDGAKKQGISGVKVVEGHTVMEVVCGGVLGVIIGMIGCLW